MNRNCKHQQLTNNDHLLLYLSPVFEYWGFENNISIIVIELCILFHILAVSIIVYHLIKHFFPKLSFLLLPQYKNILLSYTSIDYIVHYFRMSLSESSSFGMLY